MVLNGRLIRLAVPLTGFISSLGLRRRRRCFWAVLRYEVEYFTMYWMEKQKQIVDVGGGPFGRRPGVQRLVVVGPERADDDDIGRRTTDVCVEQTQLRRRRFP